LPFDEAVEEAGDVDDWEDVTIPEKESVTTPEMAPPRRGSLPDVDTSEPVPHKRSVVERDPFIYVFTCWLEHARVTGADYKGLLAVLLYS